MTWTQLAGADSAGGRLTLHRDESGVFMIRVDGMELMNGRCHRSEDVLGRMAGEATSVSNPRVLIGGLGLGYTAAAAAAALAGRGSITVAELSPEVLAWYERHVEPALFGPRPANLRLVQGDVAGLLDAGRRYDVIVLDVDNGPRPLSAPANAHLYDAEGLARLKSSLAQGGSLLVWSGFEAPDFAGRAAAAGFAVACREVPLPERQGLSHYIYSLA